MEHPNVQDNPGPSGNSNHTTNVPDYEEYEEDERFEYTSRVAVVFLIDARKKMFEGGENSYFYQALEAIREMLLNLGRRKMNNFITGIVAFGTDKSSSNHVPPHVAEIQPLGFPVVEKVLQINNFFESNHGFCEHSEYGQSEIFSLAAAIYQCQVLIKKWKSKLYSKGIVILTCDDDPFSSDVKEAHRARKAAEELYASKIGLDVIPFGNFDPKLFYHELVTTSRGDDPTEATNIVGFDGAAGLIKAVEGYMIKYTRMIRKLVLGEGKEILVTLFKMYSEPPSFLSKSDDSDKASPQTPIVQAAIGGQSNQAVKVDIPRSRKSEKYPFLGGRYLNITRSNFEKLSPRIGTGLKVIGFYPTERIPYHYSVSNTYLLAPFDEDHDSKKLLSCLLSRCTDRDLSILAWYQYNKKSEPSLVALIPNTMDHLVQTNVYPQGFSLVVIPFEDEICDYEDDEEQEPAEPTEDQQEAMNEVVKKLSFPYKPQMFHDFDYRRQVALYEALALNYNEKENVEDDTDSAVLKDLKDLPERVMNFSHLRKDAFGHPQDEDEERPSAPKQRKKVSLTLGEIKDIILAHQAESLTVSQLKDYLKFEGVKSLSSKSKPVLIEMAYELSKARKN